MDFYFVFLVVVVVVVAKPVDSNFYYFFLFVCFKKRHVKTNKLFPRSFLKQHAKKKHKKNSFKFIALN